MSMILLTSIQVAACGYVLYVCCMVLNAMTKNTRHTVRWSYLALSFGSLAGIVGEPSLSGCVYAIDVALFLACNERRHHASQPKSFS